MRRVWHYLCVVRRGAVVINEVALDEHAVGATGVGRVAQDIVDLLMMRLGPSGLAHMNRAAVTSLRMRSANDTLSSMKAPC